MKSEPKSIPFEEFATNLETIFDQVKENGEELTVEHGGTLYVLRPETRRSGRKIQPMTRNDPMWDIVGIASSGEPGNTVASNKYPHVAEAIAGEFSCTAVQ